MDATVNISALNSFCKEKSTSRTSLVLVFIHKFAITSHKNYKQFWCLYYVQCTRSKKPLGLLFHSFHNNVSVLWWMVFKKNSLPHLVNLFAIYTGTSYSFEFHSSKEFFSCTLNLPYCVCIRLFSAILFFKAVCQQQHKQSNRKGEKKNRKLIPITLFDKCAERMNGW